MRRRPPSRNINIRYPLPLFEALSAEAKVRGTTVSRVVVEIAAQEVARRNRLGEHFLNDYDIYSDRDAKANENAAIASVIAGAPQPDQRPQWQIDEEERMIAEALADDNALRITHLPLQPDPLDRIAAALEAQNAILGRLADAVDGIAAVAITLDRVLETAETNMSEDPRVWIMEAIDAADPLEIPL